jgi:hypothetical protein
MLIAAATGFKIERKRLQPPLCSEREHNGQPAKWLPVSHLPFDPVTPAGWDDEIVPCLQQPGLSFVLELKSRRSAERPAELSGEGRGDICYSDCRRADALICR